MFDPKLEAMRKRLAKIWGVAPYRVEVGSNGSFSVDGRDPSAEQMAKWKADIELVRNKVAVVRARGSKLAN